MVGGGGGGGGGSGNQCNIESGGGDVASSSSAAHFHSSHSSGEKTIEQPVLAKSSVTSTGQSIPSYATIWRPDNMSKYAVIGSSAATNYRGKKPSLAIQNSNRNPIRI